ncbi:MAG: 2-succinyl-5-enolpyruvyl-6-hydroxy-3-cyclohexene-1-carboxylic-acid synthase [Planctomycetota bacterium]
MSAHANERHAAAIVARLCAAGVQHVFVSPGSRSTPLVAAIVRAKLPATLIVDERAAGFAAVGGARAGVCAAVLTTSGTAVANLLPAVAEAGADELPWVALTADRPRDEVGIGANQTLDQPPLLAGAARAVIDLDVPDGTSAYAGLETALAALVGPSPGPVHVNVRFSKPLEPSGAEVRVPAVERAPGAARLEPPEAPWDGVTRGLVVVGALPLAARAGAARLLERLAWPALVDLTSGLDRRTPGRFAPALLRAEAARRRLDPERVLWLGGRLTEPAVAAWLAGRDVTQWRTGAARRDPDGIMTRSFVVDFAGELPSTATARASELHLAALARSEPTLDADLTEPWVARCVVESGRAGTHLFVGSSMPIRDADRFARSLDANLLANRGASGIDGNLATAFGAWATTGRPVTALVGDLAILHDAGTLATIAEHAAPIRIVVVNNHGGGIFHFLPIAADAALFEPWFGTPHTRSPVAIARGFGVDARRVVTSAELSAALVESPTGPEVLEVVTERAANRDLHAALDRAYREALA